MAHWLIVRKKCLVYQNILATAEIFNPLNPRRDCSTWSRPHYCKAECLVSTARDGRSESERYSRSLHDLPRTDCSPPMLICNKDLMMANTHIVLRKLFSKLGRRHSRPGLPATHLIHAITFVIDLVSSMSTCMTAIPTKTLSSIEA